MKNANQYDIIIVGGSYSGLAAAMALGRSMRNVLVIDDEKPCNSQTPYSHNFITNDGLSPKEITDNARKQVKFYSTVHFLRARVITGVKTPAGFVIETNTGQKFTAIKLIFATGIKDIMPSIKGFSECWGISLLHCPYCHGYEVRNQKTGIMGNGQYAFEFSALISNWTKDLTLYTNGKSTLTAEQATILQGHGIDIIEDEIGQLQHTKGYVEKIIFKSGKSQFLSAIYARAPFEQHCKIPEALGCELSNDGYLTVDKFQKTTIEGVFACGDNTIRLRTVANAVASGTTAGMMVNKELTEEEFVIKQPK